MKRRLLDFLAILLGLVLLGGNSASGGVGRPGRTTLDSVKTEVTARLLAESELPESKRSYADLINYARTTLTIQKANSGPALSALIEPSTLALWPRKQVCRNDKFAVAIDIDPDRKAFDLDDPPLPITGLASTLSELRNEGITIVWVTSLPSDGAARLRTTLAASELDVAGSDFLAMASGHESKHESLRKVAADVCLIAIAGDRMGDFEQGYEFLRDKSGLIANNLRSNLDNGWFLLPPPLS